MKSVRRLFPLLSRRRGMVPLSTIKNGLRNWKKPTVAVAMSGGIDSSAAALLLKEQGYDCIGVYMKNWDTSDEAGMETCSYSEDLNDMQEVCQRLDMPHVQVDFCKEYWNEVFEPFLDSYRTGLETPNPDVYCNRQVKFNHLRAYALDRLGADYLATGHYARLLNGQLLRGKDVSKDQSYFLSMTKGEMFDRVLFPVGEMHKKYVKALVQERFAGLNVLVKKESMGICFIGKRPMQEFLANYINFTPGRYIDWDTGRVVGEHQGVEYFTLGQKARIGGVSDKYFIASKTSSPIAADKHRLGDIYVVKGSDHPALFRESVALDFSSFHWINGTPPPSLLTREDDSVEMPMQFKARYGQKVANCFVRITPSKTTGECKLVVRFENKQRALTPGQIFVLYDGDVCLGGVPIPREEQLQ